METMTLTQLRYVIAVAESKSMNEASKQLFVSQPSLSSAIKELEAETGVEIFRRSNKGVVITPEGEEFIGYARQVVEQYKLIETKYIEKSNEKKKFAVSTQHYTFAVNAFVQMVKQFGMNEYEFAIRETKTYEVIEDVKNFKSEIGILYINEFNKKVLFKLFSEYGLTFHPILDCSIYVYIWKGHPLADKKELTLEELSDYPCLSFEQGNNNSFYFSEVFISMLDFPKSIQVRDRATLFNLVIGLNGFTVSSGVIDQKLNGSSIIAKPLDVDKTMRIGIIKKKNIIFSRYASYYVEALRKHL